MGFSSCPPSPSPSSLLLLSLLLLLLCLDPVVHAACLSDSDIASATRFSTLSLSEGTSVTIPAGETYLYDLPSSPVLSRISVKGKLLVEDVVDLALDAEEVTVFDGGEFLVGACDCPFKVKFTITLHTGSDKNADPYGVGTKSIGVLDGGTLSLYGDVRGPTWTRLSATVNAGETTFTLVEAAEWVAGDRVVLAQTDFQRWHSEQDIADPTHYNFADSWDDFSDEREILSVSTDRKTFTVTEPFTHQHYADIVHDVNMQGEVALLTRNIVVQGDEGSIEDSFGAHLMFLKGAEIVVSGIEVTRAGQKGFLGRYPIHFHMMGDCDGCAVLDSSIHHNFQRALTVHATNNLLIARTVAYRTFGHMYFLEDGIEMNNIFSHNIGITAYKIQTSDQLPLITSDNAPAIFWITNPANSFMHNVAVGSPSHCIWIALPRNPLGPSHTRSMVPRFMPLGTFAHNTAHSCAQDGLHIDRGPNQLGVAGGSDTDAIRQYTSIDGDGKSHTITIGENYEPFKDFSVSMLESYDEWEKRVPEPAVVASFTAWKCANRGIWTRTGHLIVTAARISDCAIGATFATNGSGYGILDNSVFIGESDNYGEVTSWESSNLIYGFIDDRDSEPFRSVPKTTKPADIPDGHKIGPYYPLRGPESYDGANEFTNIRCYNFHPNSRRDASCISMLRDDEFTISPYNRAQQIESPDDSVLISFPDLVHDGDKSSLLWDMDGTITGRPPPSSKPNNFAVVTNNLPFLKTSSCVDSDFGDTYFCPNHFTRFQVSFLSTPQYPSDLTTMDGLVALYRNDATSDPFFMCGGQCNGGTDVNGKLSKSSYMVGVIMYWREYYLHFLTASYPSKVSLRVAGVSSDIRDADEDLPPREIILAVCYPQGASITHVRYKYQDNIPAAESLEDMRTREIVASWPDYYHGVWFHDTDSGYLYIRMIEPTDEWGVITEITASGGSGAGNCAMKEVGQVSDTHRTLPSKGTPPQAPALAPKVTAVERGEPGCGGFIVNCELSEWVDGPCEGTCGEEDVTGTFSSTRTVVTEASGGGAECDSLTRTGSCNIPPCGSDPCQEASEWSSFSSCDCATSTRTRSRIFKYPQAAAADDSCGPSTESEACVVDCGSGSLSGGAVVRPVFGFVIVALVMFFAAV